MSDKYHVGNGALLRPGMQREKIRGDEIGNKTQCLLLPPQATEAAMEDAKQDTGNEKIGM